MNFAAHFFLDRTRPESLFHIGAASPDLLSIFNASLRIKESHMKEVDLDELSPEERSFALGLHRHFHADRVFHSSSFFTEECAYLSNKLSESFPGGEVPRKFFIAHILLELLLDKVLIENHPGMLEEYYFHFNSVAPELVQKVTETIMGQALPNYDNFIRKFIGNQYLYEYQRLDHIGFVITRILRRVRIDQIEFARDDTFINFMKAYQVRLETRYQGIFEEIRIAGNSD